MTELDVKKESQLYIHPRVQDFLGGGRVARKTLEDYFKAEGPADSTALLDNFNIDETLDKWAKHSEDIFKGNKFYHIPFQMIDFSRHNTELANLDIPKLIKEGYKSFGVVLNTDVSSGGGKHWFAIYGDLDHKGTDKDPLIIEYFNSSGNSPMREVADWLEAMQHTLLKNYSLEVEIVRSANRRLQNSMTECGVWSLMYLLSRLKNHPSDWFYKTNANDADMIDLRAFLFRKADGDK
jgi:Ulp1 protease family, C-terminal catalytic domain